MSPYALQSLILFIIGKVFNILARPHFTTWTPGTWSNFKAVSPSWSSFMGRVFMIKIHIFAYNNYPPDFCGIEDVNEILMTFILQDVPFWCRRCRRSLTRRVICCWSLGLSWWIIAESKLCNWVEWRIFLWRWCWRSCLKMKMILLDDDVRLTEVKATFSCWMWRQCLLDGDDDEVAEDEAVEAEAKGYEAESMKMRPRKPKLKERWIWGCGRPEWRRDEAESLKMRPRKSRLKKKNVPSTTS